MVSSREIERLPASWEALGTHAEHARNIRLNRTSSYVRGRDVVRIHSLELTLSMIPVLLAKKNLTLFRTSKNTPAPYWIMSLHMWTEFQLERSLLKTSRFRRDPHNKVHTYSRYIYFRIFEGRPTNLRPIRTIKHWVLTCQISCMFKTSTSAHHETTLLKILRQEPINLPQKEMNTPLKPAR